MIYIESGSESESGDEDEDEDDDDDDDDEEDGDEDEHHEVHNIVDEIDVGPSSPKRRSQQKF